MIARKLVAIVGPTAAGKSAVAMELAGRFGGAIVNADSRQVFRGMDIGTAKPSAADQSRIPHRLYDIAEPADGFSLALYLQKAKGALATSWAEGTVPWLVGGTGQFVWALLEAWTVPEVPPDSALRAELTAFAVSAGNDALHARLQDIDPVAASRIEPANVRRVVRALEVHHHTGRPISEWQQKGDPGFGFLVLGVEQSDEVLQERIAERVRAMYAGGLVDEAARLVAGGLAIDAPAMSAIGYREAAQVSRGEMEEESAIEQTVVATRRLVRRQRQWFRASDERITWGSNSAQFDDEVSRFLTLGA